MKTYHKLCPELESRRITAWQKPCKMDYLISEMNRIEKQSEGKDNCKCVIITIEKSSALFFVNGMYKRVFKSGSVVDLVWVPEDMGVKK